MILVNVDAATAVEAVGGLGLCARVSSEDRKVLTWFCPRLYRCGSAGNRARRVPEVAGYG